MRGLRGNRRPRRGEIVILLGATVLCAGLYDWTLSTPRTGAPAVPERPGSGGLFDHNLDPGRFHHFEITIRPEFIRALDAAIPKDRDLFKMRGKVPVEKLVVDGRELEGPFSARYRGWTYVHWRYRQKSLKITAPEDGGILGYKTLNINTLEVDPFLYENWANRLLHRTGGVASRLNFARLTLNGEYMGLRVLSENLDADLIAHQGLPKGALYRERTNVVLGRRFLSDEELRSLWKKNALKRSGWDDLRRFNDAIFKAVSGGGDSFLDHLNVGQYVNYQAVATLTGTTHLSNHNIPVYRPLRESRFIPVGYDFGGNAQGELFSRFPAVQEPYAAQNRLSQLFFADPALRRRIHRRIAEILATFPDIARSYDEILRSAEPDLERDFAAGRVFENAKYKSGLAAYREANQVRGQIRARSEFMRRVYLDPLARVTPGWVDLERSQLAVEGAGAYEVRFAGAGAPCSGDAQARLSVHKGRWQAAARCRGGRLETVTVIAERNDIVRPTLYADSAVKRNSVGVVLVDIENAGKLPLRGLAVGSLQTGRPVPLKDDWPFMIEKLDDSRASIGSPSLPYLSDLRGSASGGYSFVRLPGQSDHAFEPGRGVLEFKEPVKGPGAAAAGPMLCWRMGGRPSCYEFTAHYTPPGEAQTGEPAPAASPGMKTVDLAGFSTCRVFFFRKGDYRIAGPAVSPPRCRVIFGAGARLFFEPGAFMVIRGEFLFPWRGELVEFRARRKRWGGLVVTQGRKACAVRNARFSGSDEFLWNAERYTAVLTFRGLSHCEINNNVFADNHGDDAVNVRGGHAKIFRNLFRRNRDAIDIDATDAEILIEDNVILDSADDGVDLGGASNVVLRRNVIRGSGDKGVSVGEGASVRVEISLLEANNVGIAVKERSRARLSDPILKDNRIALSVYRGPDAGKNDRGGLLEGALALSGNARALQIDGAPREPGPAGLDEASYSPSMRVRLIKEVMEQCPSCRPAGKELALSHE